MSANLVSDWRRALLGGAFVLFWIVIWYWQTAAAMVSIWARSDTFTHCFVVVPIVAWLIWRQRDRLLALEPRPNARILGLIALVGFGWLLGELASVNALTQLALVMLIALAVMAVFGLRVASAIAFPLAFLFFAVPIGEFVMPLLMEWTASFTVIGLRLTGVPVYQEGLQFVIPSGTWSVVEACSGVRYLIASLTVGTLFAYLNYQSFRRRIVFIAFSIAVPIAANWMRAYMIVMLGHLSGNKIAAGVDHLIYGWLFFGVVMLLMFIVGTRWSEDQPALATSGVVRLSSGALTTNGRFGGVLLSVAILTALPQAGMWMLEHGDRARADLAIAPISLDAAAGWRELPERIADWRPAFENPSAELQTSFTHDGRVVGLYLGYYRNQDFGRKLVSSTNVLVKSKDPEWALVGKAGRDIRYNQQPVTVVTAELRGTAQTVGAGGERLSAWQWYWINGYLTASDYRAKAYTALSRLLGQGDDSAVIILYAPKDQPGGGEGALEAFSVAAGAAIEDALQKTRQQR